MVTHPPSPVCLCGRHGETGSMESQQWHRGELGNNRKSEIYWIICEISFIPRNVKVFCDCSFITKKPNKLCPYITHSMLCGAEGRDGTAVNTGRSYRWEAALRLPSRRSLHGDLDCVLILRLENRVAHCQSMLTFILNSLSAMIGLCIIHKH